MDKYIIELLDTNTRVIIPDFGAFIIKQKEPRIIVFNEFLRYNDGLLIDYVAKSENIDKNAAKKKVVEYVAKAGKNLTDNNEHLITGLGTLIKESTGKITFEEISETAKKVSKKKEPKKVTETKEEKKEKTDEIKKETPEKKDEAKEETPEKKDEAKEISKPAPAKPKPEKEIVKAAQEEPVERKTAPGIAQDQAKKEIIAKKEEERTEKAKEEPKLRPAAYQTKEIRKKKKSNSQIIVWIILILLINAAIISWFVFNDEIRNLFEKQPKDIIIMEEENADQTIGVADEQEGAAVSEEADIEEISTDIQQQVTREPEAAPEIEEESISYSEKRYYIVAGCFRDERNADALVKKLKQKGYDAEKFGKIGNLHAVSYSSFIDRTEAQNQLRRIREEEEQEAWLTYY
jgi:cell division septation protein DedD